jgi:hypothetical protein
MGQQPRGPRDPAGHSSTQCTGLWRVHCACTLTQDLALHLRPHAGITQACAGSGTHAWRAPMNASMQLSTTNDQEQRVCVCVCVQHPLCIAAEPVQGTPATGVTHSCRGPG